MQVCSECGREVDLEQVGPCPDCEGTTVLVGADLAVGPGRVLGDRYVLLKELGKGGMGSVYLAKHRLLDKQVAVKVMALELAASEQALSRFRQEARNAARLEHPNNVKVFDFGDEAKHLIYIVMELARGEPLASFRLPLPVPRALRIASQICRALSEAHQLGLVHRDLKPDNVMITELDGEEFARVLDYGIAKSLNAAGPVLTRTGTMLGTPRYISPEQAVGHEVDARSDVYSLGAMLFEMVTGRPPFEAPNAIALALAHIKRPPPRPSDYAAVPAPVESLILRALAKEPEARPQSMDDVREAIEAYLEGRDQTALGRTPDIGPAGIQASPQEARAAPAKAVLAETRVAPEEVAAVLAETRAVPEERVEAELVATRAAPAETGAPIESHPNVDAAGAIPRSAAPGPTTADPRTAGTGRLPEPARSLAPRHALRPGRLIAFTVGALALAFLGILVFGVDPTSPRTDRRDTLEAGSRSPSWFWRQPSDENADTSEASADRHGFWRREPEADRTASETAPRRSIFWDRRAEARERQADRTSPARRGHTRESAGNEEDSDPGSARSRSGRGFLRGVRRGIRRVFR